MRVATSVEEFGTKKKEHEAWGTVSGWKEFLIPNQASGSR